MAKTQALSALAGSGTKHPSAKQAGQGAGVPAPLFGTSTRTASRSLAPVSGVRHDRKAAPDESLREFLEGRGSQTGSG
jgi:hypothetical protein